MFYPFRSWFFAIFLNICAGIWPNDKGPRWTAVHPEGKRNRMPRVGRNKPPRGALHSRLSALHPLLLSTNWLDLRHLSLSHRQQIGCVRCTRMQHKRRMSWALQLGRKLFCSIRRIPPGGLAKRVAAAGTSRPTTSNLFDLHLPKFTLTRTELRITIHSMPIMAPSGARRKGTFSAWGVNLNMD